MGKPGRLLGDAISEYERRARRYWNLDVTEVREEKASGGRVAHQIRAAEAQRLLERIPDGYVVIALTREGAGWSSSHFARQLEAWAVEARAGVAFLIGGAYGLGDEALERASQRLSLSSATLPHDLARLVLAEQIYRAGTILRGEPYHKAAE